MSALNKYFAESNQAFNFRANLIIGSVLYAVYGIVDYFMMPFHFLDAWIIRFIFIGSVVIIFVFMSYKKWFLIYIDKSLIAFMFLGQIGIFIIMFITSSYERAYYDYYIGLTLVFFVSAFVFKISLKAIIWLIILTIICYFFYTIFHNHIIPSNPNSLEYVIFINSIIFLLSTGFLTIFGKYLIDHYQNRIDIEKKEIQKALKKAEESDQMKSSFLSTMSHELRTPLNGIIGFSDLLIDDIDINEKYKLIKGINKQGYQLLDILDIMLEYTQLQSELDLGKKLRKPIKLIVKETKRSFILHQEKMHKKQISFISEIEPKYLNSFIFTYHDKLLLVIDALINNAIKYSDSGVVKLSMRVINNRDIVLSICDEGIGLDEDLNHVVFNDFRQVETSHNRNYGGIGMGLSISNKILNLMGGKIWYKKNTKIGTTFYFSIPKSYSRV